MIIKSVRSCFEKYIASNLNITNSASSFSTDTMNFRVPIRDPRTGKLTDQFVHLYNNRMFSAYLEKRRVKRSEIWPKIHVLSDPPESEIHHIKSQKLFEVKKLLEDDLIKKIIKEDLSQINSVFIISVFSEEGFKELLDQYVSKRLICGKAPAENSIAQINELEAEVMALYRNFYFGERITLLEREIEIKYLAAKQNKYIRKQIMKKNVHLSCTWREQDQRLLEDFVNWPDSNINLSDLSFRPFYQPLVINARLPFAEKFHVLMGGDPYLQKRNFNRTVKKSYVYSVEYLNWIASKLFSRTIQYTKCLEFTSTMKIPPDFMIELLILNLHIWLMVDRLKQFKTKKSTNLATILERTFQSYVNDLLGSLNIKKLAVTTKIFQQILSAARSALNMHFNMYQNTKANPYLNIDALIWSVAMKQKTERYGDEVYAFSEYIIRNWQHLKNFDEEDFVDGICEFDCYLLDPDHKQQIVAINPQMAKQQFEEQFASNKQNKKYYYKTAMKNSEFNIDFKSLKFNESLEYSFWSQLINKIISFSKKYMTNIDYYDHFSEMDQQKKKIEKKDESSPWKTEKDRLMETNEQFNSVDQIRRSRRRARSSSNIERDATQYENKKKQ